jgi:hypothetical protein
MIYKKAKVLSAGLKSVCFLKVKGDTSIMVGAWQLINRTEISEIATPNLTTYEDCSEKEFNQAFNNAVKSLKS